MTERDANDHLAVVTGGLIEAYGPGSAMTMLATALVNILLYVSNPEDAAAYLRELAAMVERGAPVPPGSLN